MGPQAAINAVFYNQLQAIEDDDERASSSTEELRREYAEDIDILHLASELVVDAVIEPEELRAEVMRRFAHAPGKRRDWPSGATPSRRSETAAPPSGLGGAVDQVLRSVSGAERGHGTDAPPTRRRLRA